MTHNISDTYRPSLLKYPTYDKEGWPLNPHKSLIHKGRKRKLKRQDHYRRPDQKQAREDLKWQKEQDRIERERQRSQEDWYY
jgi:predicted RNA polymerase sigma factor